MATKKGTEFAAAAVLLFGLLSLSFYDVFFLGKTFKVTTAIAQTMPYGPYNQSENRPRFVPVNGTDSPVLEEPTYAFIKKNLRRGILPLWNPHQACGFPLIALIQVGMFFPLNFILYAFPSSLAWDILIISRFLLAGLLTYAFLRRLRMDRISSASGAVVFMLTGPMVLLQYWTANVDILLPLVLLCYENIIRSASTRDLGFGAAAVGLTVLAGHPEHVFLVNALAVAYFCFRLATIRPRVSWKKRATWLVTALVLGAGIAAVVIFPFVRNFTATLWNAHPLGVGLTTGEHQYKFISVFLPHFFQKEPLTYDFHFAGWWGGYIGILPFAFVFFSLFGRQRQGLNTFFAIAAVLIIGKCYAVPIINWIGYLPVFHKIRFYIHATHLFSFCMAVLAAMGVRSLGLHRRVLKKGLLFVLIVFVLVALHLLYFQKADHFPLSMRAAAFCFALLAFFLSLLYLRDTGHLSRRCLGLLLTGLLVFELFAYIHRERPARFDSFGRVPYVEWLKERPGRDRVYGIFGALYPNTASGYFVDDLGIFFGLVPERFVKYVNSLLIEDLFRNNLRPPALRTIPVTFLPDKKPFLNILNVRYTIAPKSLGRIMPVTRHPGFADPLYDEEVKIFSHPEALPRAYAVHRVLFESDDERVLELLKKHKNLLASMAVISAAPDDELNQRLLSAPLVDSSRIDIVRYTANEVWLEAHMQNDGLVVLSDGYHPDWKAFVDGRPARIYPTNYLVRSVFVPGGNHKIRFAFRPFWFYVGSAVSLVCLSIVIYLIRSKS